MRIGVVGCGNVGFSTLQVSVEHGHQVLGYDSDGVVRRRISDQLGIAAVAEQLSDLVQCDLIFVCVPTNSKTTGECDLSTFELVISSLGASIKRASERRPLIVQRSTCPPGTARRMNALVDAPYAVCPSFLTKNTILKDARDPPRIAYASDLRGCEILADYFRVYDQTRIFRSTRFETIELLKYIENAIDGVLVSLWNEFLAYALQSDVTIDEFTKLMDHIGDRPRFASAIRVPGGAFGKWCLPKDLNALIFDAAVRFSPHGVLAGTHQTNAWVREEIGENPHAYYELLQEQGGRLKLTETAKAWLVHAGHNWSTILKNEGVI